VVFSWFVDTLSHLTNPRILRTLVDVHTHETCLVQAEPFVTRTHKAAESVGAVSILANVLVFFALVDVLQHDLESNALTLIDHDWCPYREIIRFVPHPSGTELLVLDAVERGTQFALRPPGFPHGAATRCFGHVIGSVGVAPTLLVQLDVAPRRPPIYKHCQRERSRVVLEYLCKRFLRRLVRSLGGKYTESFRRDSYICRRDKTGGFRTRRCPYSCPRNRLVCTRRDSRTGTFQKCFRIYRRRTNC
jgi:hypothetical protein